MPKRRNNQKCCVITLKAKIEESGYKYTFYTSVNKFFLNPCVSIQKVKFFSTTSVKTCFTTFKVPVLPFCLLQDEVFRKMGKSYENYQAPFKSALWFSIMNGSSNAVLDPSQDGRPTDPNDLQFNPLFWQETKLFNADVNNATVLVANSNLSQCRFHYLQFSWEKKAVA